jgi:hypothetical protein
MSGGCARYWTIGSKGYDAANAQGDGEDETEKSGLDILLQDANKRLRETNEQWRRAGETQQGADHDDGFVKDMRWVKFTEGKDRAVIAAPKRTRLDSSTISVHGRQS